MSPRVGPWTGLLLLGACVPTFEDRPWRVDRERIVAIAATPAEALPGQAVTLEALVVGPQGPSSGPVEWSACTQPRTARERTAVSDACARGEALDSLGSPAVVPADACARFGPNPPPTEGDAPARRPADPDRSGGYFLPVHASADGTVGAFGFVRLRCDLAGVTRPVFEDYQARYQLNVGPRIDALSLRDGEARTSLEGEARPAVAAGSTVELELVAAADSSESYVALDDAGTSLEDRREDLTVRWYVTEGELSRGEATRRGAELGDDVPVFAVQWQAPAEAAMVHGWAVLADERGAVTWAEFTLDVGASPPAAGR